jgi:hypothetical protein
VEHDAQTWTLLVAQGRFTPELRGYAEVQPRIADSWTRFDRLLVRAALGWQVSPAVSLWIGYAWTPLISPRFIHEHRPFQQLLIENRWGKFSLINRTRLEERFIEGLPVASARLRHMVRGLYQLGESPWRLAAYDEAFVTLNAVESGPVAGFDQNRAFLGVNWQVHPVLQLEAGYLNHVVRRAAPAQMLMNHILVTMLVASF